MSADNWGICPNPKCDQPLDEYDERRTLREDYEICFHPEGSANFMVSYSGRCECGFNYTFTRNEVVAV